MLAFFIFLYTFIMKSTNRGSITPFFIIVVSLIVIIGLIIFEYTFYSFSYSKAKVNMYAEMDKVMSEYDRKLFNEVGLLAVKKDNLKKPIADIDVLEKQIESLMDQKSLVKSVAMAESIVNEFIKRKTKVKLKSFDVSYLNLKLYTIIDGRASKRDIKEFITNLASVSLYAELQGISVNRLKDLISNLRFEELKNIRPVFVLRSSIRKNFKKILSAYKKYDKLGVYKHYFLADYSIDYIGYNLTKTKSYLTSEYIATGIANKKISKYAVLSEIYLIRILLDFMETFVNPKVRDKIKKMSFGSPKLFAIEAVAFSAIEAFYDTNRIRNGGKIPIYKGKGGFIVFSISNKYYKNGFTYPHYLKMVIMIIPKKIVLNRMVYVIEKRFKIKLSEHFTEIDVKRKTEFKGRLIPFKFEKTIEGKLSYE